MAGLMNNEISMLFQGKEVQYDDNGCTSVRVTWLVTLAEEKDDPETEAVKAVLDGTPDTWNGIENRTARTIEILSLTEFKVEVEYSRDGDSGGGSSSEEDKSSIAFEIGGNGTQKIFISQSTKRYPETAPDYKGLINVQEDGTVSGVEIPASYFRFSETYRIAPSSITTQYTRNIGRCYMRVNKYPFRGYLPGEVRFIGCTGQRTGTSSSDMYQMTFNFEVSENYKEEVIQGFDQKISKNGFDYIWFTYRDDKVPVQEDGKEKIYRVKRAKAAYVEQISKYADFGILRIPGVNVSKETKATGNPG
ncbi:MAG: hypothetical protein BWY31_04591 [Lentisphaerae bacterium ADurb.Bin242]|nr:MAG: hypothetical protein BWY31_04591 [Lentisphaerae bacterium ADurb.Bin242]